MPLKVIKRKNCKNWYIRGSHKGEEIYYSTGTSERTVAERIRHEHEKELQKDAGQKTLSHAIKAYIERGGEKTYLKEIKHEQ